MKAEENSVVFSDVLKLATVGDDLNSKNFSKRSRIRYRPHDAPLGGKHSAFPCMQPTFRLCFRDQFYRYRALETDAKKVPLRPEESELSSPGLWRSRASG